MRRRENRKGEDEDESGEDEEEPEEEEEREEDDCVDAPAPIATAAGHAEQPPAVAAPAAAEPAAAGPASAEIVEATLVLPVAAAEEENEDGQRADAEATGERSNNRYVLGCFFLPAGWQGEVGGLVVNSSCQQDPS